MAIINPYEYTRTAADSTLADVKAKGAEAQARSETYKEIGSLKDELAYTSGKAREKAEGEMKKALEQAEEDRKKAERSSRKYGGLFKGLKVLSMFLGPIAGGVISGLVTGAQTNRQKKALEKLGGRMGKLGKYLKDVDINMGAGWKGKTQGLSWLSDPTMKQEQALDKYIDTGSSSMMDSAEQVKKAAGKIDPLKSALVTGLTTYLTKEKMGEEGIFSGGDASVATTAAEAGASTVPAVEQAALAGELGVDVSQLGLMPETAVKATMDKTFGEKLKQQFLTGEGGELLTGKDRTERLLKLLPMFTGILQEDQGLGIPEIDPDAFGSAPGSGYYY